MSRGACTFCHRYPEGSACAASGCPGRPFKKTPAPHLLGSDNASGTHQGHAAEVTNDGGTTGIIARRECVAMASGGRALVASCPPQIYDSGDELPAWPFQHFTDPRRKLRVLSLFAGIGGFDLGLERTGGFETVAFCEIEPFAQRVLAKHWPKVPCYDDVRTLAADRLVADGIAVDVICGGFPCQDISFAGLGAGLEGERSGLFYEIARLIGELGPRFVILENVGALLSRGLDAVLGTLASLGYDAEWHCIPASAVGAPHRRDRVWIVAFHADSFNDREIGAICRGPNAKSGGIRKAVADPNGMHEQGFVAKFIDSQGWPGPQQGSPGPCGDGFGQWAVEPNVGRVANGVPDRAHRLKALGNAVVPQVVELIGNAILQALRQPIGGNGLALDLLHGGMPVVVSSHGRSYGKSAV